MFGLNAIEIHLTSLFSLQRLQASSHLLRTVSYLKTVSHIISLSFFFFVFFYFFHFTFCSLLQPWEVREASVEQDPSGCGYRINTTHCITYPLKEILKRAAVN